jgi:3-hydroxyacyl-CoA dehydrogenase/enoyl-CoA hydratase/3-hydroxybutyryl-CoA epimerase
MSRAVRLEPADACGIARIVLDRPDDAVNAINLEVVDGLTDAVRAIRAASPRGVILTSAKDGQWVAGADLKLITQASDQLQIEAAAHRLQAALDELAWLPCTTVAAINGAALGGGLELALACDYRVASDAPSVSLGQPEVNLGLVPAGGGTQRLPRLIGLERALDLLLTGRRLNARRAQRAGLLDEVVHPAVLNQAARAWAARPKRSLDRRLHLGLDLRTAIEIGELTPVGRQLIYRQARQSVLERTRGHYPAPLRVLEAVEVGFEHGMADGLEAEARAFGELATSETAAKLIWLFVATQHARRRGAKRISRLGVVGGGFMGAAIAEVAAAEDIDVRIKDTSSAAAARGLASASNIVESSVHRRRILPREGRAIQRRISAGADYSGFARSEAVIEAVFEDLMLKRSIVRDLEQVVSSVALIASNTSAIPIHEIAKGAAHPERIVGMHFFSPAERMPLVEVVRPDAANQVAVDDALALGRQLGKTPILVSDSPGFYTSRVLGVMLNEAALLLGEGARLEDVDRAMTDFGFPVGPFVLFDEVGLEVAQHVGETVAAAFGDRIPAASVVADLVSRGETGRKAGRGFYVWPAESRRPSFVRRFAPRSRRSANPYVYQGAARHPFAVQHLQDRLVLLFVNEAIRCLDEGVLESAADGDIGAVLGLGFPPFRGGPFHYADSLGAAALSARLRDLAERVGQRYAPAQSLIEGQSFFKLEDQP